MVSNLAVSHPLMFDQYEPSSLVFVDVDPIEIRSQLRLRRRLSPPESDPSMPDCNFNTPTADLINPLQPRVEVLGKSDMF